MLYRASYTKPSLKLRSFAILLLLTCSLGLADSKAAPTYTEIYRTPCALMRWLGAKQKEGFPYTAQQIAAVKDRNLRRELRDFKAVQLEQARRYAFRNEMKSPALRRLPDGIREKYRPALERIFELFMDHAGHFELVQQLEMEIFFRAKSEGIPFAQAYEKVLGEWEERHGFKPVVTLPNRQLSPEEFMAMLREGSLFLDTNFKDGNFQNGGRRAADAQAHGETTHRVIQWHAIMRDMEAHPERYGEVKDASDLFRALGSVPQLGFLDFKISGVPGAQGSKNGMWRYLFDEPFDEPFASREVSSRFSPEAQRGMHDSLPLLGPLLH